ncbi:RNA polymerase sigma-70 factor [Mucilaginibacter sp. SMC90]|uniref:RNA polymerase sigma-70 factor n=1 Tax=Mucilaginibacter sp. SMC90 TaxID=2929803 RepID=UPI001FB4B979|nr:RNA polymerase sigma-70 factor [Mucilaginibacter sp. SMC90]UOE47481.1 RNA polymerase sigma-70 factor [Mucilaginibacter sp. SMC90]
MISYNSLSDSELTNLLKSDDSLAFAEIYDRYFGLLYVHAFNRVRDKEEAKDVVQELFTFLWANHATIEFKTNLSNYLYTATRNRILNLIGRKQIHERYRLKLPEYIITSGLTDHLVRERQLAEIIEKEVQALPPKMRAVFEMSRKYHMTYKEIAEQLDITEQSVRSHVKNALKILRVKLGIIAFLAFILLNK